MIRIDLYRSVLCVYKRMCQQNEVAPVVEKLCQTQGTLSEALMFTVLCTSAVKEQQQHPPHPESR